MIARRPPSGVKSLIFRRTSFIWARGTQRPAKNTIGKNSRVPIAPALLPVGATEATSRPIANIASAVSR